MKLTVVGAIMLMFSLSVTAHAVESNPKHVFIHDESCSGQLGSTVMTSFREAIRASSGYELSTSMLESGGYGVVITVYVVCSETELATNQRIISIASIIGTAVCPVASYCTVTSNEASLETQLCGNDSGRACGADMFTGMDQYMNKSPGRDIFSSLSRQKAAGR